MCVNSFHVCAVFGNQTGGDLRTSTAAPAEKGACLSVVIEVFSQYLTAWGELVTPKALC